MELWIIVLLVLAIGALQFQRWPLRGRKWITVVLVLAVGALGVVYVGTRHEDAPAAAERTSRASVEEGAPAGASSPGRRLIPDKLPHETERGSTEPEPRPGEAPAAAVQDEPGDMTEGLGLRVSDDSDRERLKIPERFKGGLVITRIHPDSPAAEVQLEEGDVIVRAHRTDITTEEELRKEMGGRDHLLITVSRAGELFQVVLKPPYRPER